VIAMLPDVSLPSLAPPDVVRAESDPLAQRMGANPAARRRAIEDHDGHRRFGHTQTWKAIENWPGSRQVIRMALAMLGVHGRARDNARAIVVRENELPIRRLSPSFDGYTLLQLSDLHIDIADDVADVIGAAVRDLRYDACVMTGDYRAETYGPHARTLAGLRALRERLGSPLFCVFGNHDSVAMLEPMEALGMRVLMNEHVCIEREGGSMYLCGVDDPHYFKSDDIDRARAGVPHGAPSILLAHSPEIYARAAAAGFDAMLCGHTHGGQLCLPGGFAIRSNAPCPRRLWAGSWRHEELAGYTSVGCGTCVVDLRLNCAPEVTLHRLRAV
jgi:predicted MPP superfamily phosphohydrolase